jgi:hypothetical protein
MHMQITSTMAQTMAMEGQITWSHVRADSEIIVGPEEGFEGVEVVAASLERNTSTVMIPPTTTPTP